jgi:hypothetical protein
MIESKTVREFALPSGHTVVVRRADFGMWAIDVWVAHTHIGTDYGPGETPSHEEQVARAERVVASARRRDGVHA